VTLFTDIARALAQMRDPRFLGVVVRAVLLTLAGLAAITVGVVAGLGWLLPDTISVPWLGPVGFVDDVVSWTAVAVMLVLSVVMMVPTAAAVVGFFLDDIAAAVEQKHYPQLPAARSLPLAEQVGDALRFFGLVVAVNVLALIAYVLLPPLAPLIFWAVNGLLLGREYFQLVALRRAAPAEAVALRRANRGRIWMAGTAMAVPLSVPFLNLLVPVLGVAVFTHQFQRITDARAVA